VKGTTYVDGVLNALYRGVSLVAPTLSVALFSDDGAVTELVGSGYARVPVGAAFLAPSGGSVTTGVALVFPTATGPWSVGSVALVDAAGLVVQQEVLTASVATGETARFAIGAMSGAES